MPKFSKLKVKKMLTLEQIASQLASDIISAVYSAVGNKVITEMRQGDDLDDVVDQYLDKQGMSEDLMRLASTRIEMQVGLDVSKSMYSRMDGRPITPGITMLRTVYRAFNIVSQTLPPDVFKFGIWLWAAGWMGEGVVGINYPTYSTQKTQFNWLGADKIDEELNNIMRSEPGWAGSGTSLAPMVDVWSKWNNDLGDPTAHKLDIVLTDGGLHDVDAVSKIQVFRQVGKYEGVLFNVGNMDHRYIYVPNGFTSHVTKTHLIGENVRMVLFDFIQKLF